MSDDSSSTPPPCPKCKADYTYIDAANFVCPSCAYEWPTVATTPTATSAPTSPDSDADDSEQDKPVRDANGNVLQTGDSVIVIKDLKVKGSSLVVKGGTKVKNIRFVQGDHDIDCKIDGIGAMQLKSQFVRKA